MKGRIPDAAPDLGEEEKEVVLDVLESKQIAAGPKVDEFEERFAEYIGVEEAVAVSSGTASLHTALLASDVSRGDKVIVSPYSFFASVSPALNIGAEPIFADIDPDTFCIRPEEIRRLAGEDTAAVIPVHLYGQPADMDEIAAVAEENDMAVIEDACQAHGSEYKGKKTGSLGDVGCFSFYASKNMVTGEGGMLTTDDPDLAERARLIREHGRGSRGEHSLVGYNFLMTDIEAAIGIVQLSKLENINEKRIRNARILNEELEDLEESSIIKRPLEADDRKHVYHQYALRVPSEKRDRTVDSMQKAGISVREGYEKPIYEQEAVKKEGDCPEAERACDEVIWVPVHQGLDPSHMSKVAWGLKQYLS